MARFGHPLLPAMREKSETLSRSAVPTMSAKIKQQLPEMFSDLVWIVDLVMREAVANGKPFERPELDAMILVAMDEIEKLKGTKQ